MVKIDSLFLVSLALMGLISIHLIRDSLTGSPGVNEETAIPADQVLSISARENGSGDLSSPDALADILPPYEHYTITQGLHGFEYGHRAVDLSAGKGALILSPIRGVVTQNTVDAYGNTILVIENERYRITLLHGIFTLQVGEQVEQGQVIGEESNQGLTYDLDGHSCRGRDCGYHTHINIYDKLKRRNINPLHWFFQK